MDPSKGDRVTDPRIAEAGMGYTPPAGALFAVTPVEDPDYAEVFPYRGTEQHGVDAGRPWTPTDATASSWEGPIKSEAPDIDPEPVPVRIVQEKNDELRTFHAFQTGCAGSAVNIVGRDTKRTDVTIKNTSAANTVWIGSDTSVTPTNGYPIAAGSSETLAVDEPIYAVATNAAAATLAVIVTYMR